MADCTRRILDLSPFDAIQCFFQADDWQLIGQNLRRMWTDLSSLSIGEWIAVALVPAVFASYILPLIFIVKLIKRYALKTPLLSDGQEPPKNFWGGYLFLSGIILVALYSHEPLLFWQGSWQATCGIAIFLLGPSWWAPLEQLQDATARRWRVVGRTALIIAVLVLIGTPMMLELYDLYLVPGPRVPQTEYAGLRLGISPDEVMRIKGYPPAVVAEVPEDPPPRGLVPSLLRRPYQGTGSVHRIIRFGPTGMGIGAVST